MDMNIELIKNAIPLLIAGAGITVEITALSVFFGMLIGIIVALARLSDFKILRWLGNVYVDFIRGTPLLIQIFLVYFALPRWRKCSAAASSPSTWVRWKPGAAWA